MGEFVAARENTERERGRSEGPIGKIMFFFVHLNRFFYIVVLGPSQYQNARLCRRASKSVSKWPRYLTKTAKNDVFRAAFPHFLLFHKYCCFRTIPGPKGNFVPKGVPVGFEMAEKNAHRHTDRYTLAALYTV